MRVVSWAFALTILAVLGLSIYQAVNTPDLWIALLKAAFGALVPSILLIIKPKDYTKEQLDRIARGQEPGAAGQVKNDDGFHHK